MGHTKKWAEANPRVSFYLHSKEELAKLEEEATRNGLSLGHYVELLVSNRRAVQQVVEQARSTPAGYGVKCYGCQTLLPTAYIESQMELQRELARPPAEAKIATDDNAETEEASVAV